MPRSHTHRSASFPPQVTAPAARRTLACLLCLLLLFGALAPAWAFAGEVESEGDGSAPAGPIPGLEEGPEYEPGGEETALVEVTGGSEEAEEEEAPVEGEPPPAPEAPSPVTGSEVEAPEAGMPPATEAAQAGEPGPTYETAPPAAAVVEGAPLSAPREATGEPSSSGDRAEPASAAPTSVAVSPPPSEAPEPQAPSQPAATPVAGEGPVSGLKGDEFHTIRPGESLWSIAAALLPVGASNTQVAAEVQRLWELNKDRIGTGDPNLILVGMVLRLR